MSRLRMIPRAAALVLLLALLIGLPCVVVATIGVPLPSPARLATSWRQRRVPGDLVIRTGAFVFALLWAWFATTAVGEFAQILRVATGSIVSNRCPQAPLVGCVASCGSWPSPPCRRRPRSAACCR